MDACSTRPQPRSTPSNHPDPLKPAQLHMSAPLLLVAVAVVAKKSMAACPETGPGCWLRVKGRSSDTQASLRCSHKSAGCQSMHANNCPPEPGRSCEAEIPLQLPHRQPFGPVLFSGTPKMAPRFSFRSPFSPHPKNGPREKPKKICVTTRIAKSHSLFDILGLPPSSRESRVRNRPPRSSRHL